jgi:hypothetical protein
MFKVQLTFIEHELTRDEVRELAYKRYGGANSVNVEFLPVDSSDSAALNFVLDSLITDKQSDILFGDKYLYEQRKEALITQVKQRIDNALEDLINHNEKSRL